MKRALLLLTLCSGLGLAAPASAHSRSEVYVEVHPAPHWSIGWRQPAWHGGHYRPWQGRAPWCHPHRAYHHHAHHDRGYRDHGRGHGRDHRDRWEDRD